MRGSRSLLLSVLLLLIAIASGQTYDDCNCDVILILDRSGSLTANDWVLEKKFATTVVQGLAGNMPPQKVGLITFASDVRLDSPLTTDEDKVLAAISASVKTNGGTYMNLAFDAAKKEFAANSAPGKCKTAKIITDGISTVPALTKTAAANLRAAGVTIVVIGVGKANQAEMNDMATDPDSLNSILLKDFTTLDQLAHSWVDKCQAPPTQPGTSTTVNFNNCDPQNLFSYPFATAVVPDLGRPVSQIVVDIEGGCKPGDVLTLSPAVAGITATWTAKDCELKLTGAADVTVAKWQAAVRNVRYTSTDKTPASNIRTLTWTIGTGLFWSVNGHYYEFVKVPKITWKDANAQANAQTRYGMPCYMATVTSKAENEFLLSKLHGSGWVGATDELKEGQWRWVTGPEGKEDSGKGRIFWDGGVTGKTVNNQYENWGNGEPNDYKPLGGEDFAHFWEAINGEWNDFPNSHADIDGYFLECGDGTAATQHFAETTKLVQFCNNCQKLRDCTNNGICLPDGTCDCNDGFAGAKCNTCQANYVNYPNCAHCAITADKCSGRGCLSGTTCICDKGFMGANCDQCAAGFYGPQCVACAPCYNGTCVAGKTGDGRCTCTAGFDPNTRCLDCLSSPQARWGPKCDKICPDCGHGQCDDGVLGTGVCLCNANFTVASGCQDCAAGFYGPACTPCPTHKCYKHGTCNDGVAGDGKCTCDQDFDPATDCQMCKAGFTVVTNTSAKLCPDHKDANGNSGNYKSDCACDLVFSVDKSQSITMKNWPLVINFLKTFVYGMKFTDVNGMRVAITSFAAPADSLKECPYSFVRADIITCIDKMVGPLPTKAGGTRTDLGMQHSLDFLKQSPAAKCKALYIISDGKPYPQSAVAPTDALIKQIQALPNTEVVSIGIGNVAMSMLQSWATPPINEHAILLKDFDGLDHLANMLQGQCPDGKDHLVESNCHCDIVIVVDRSGSIAPDWAKVQDFLRTLIYGYDIQPNGSAMRVGLVSYSTTAKLESPITSDRQALLTAINNIAAPNGNTFTDLGLNAAKAEMTKNGRPGACKSIKLLTDGKSTQPANTIAAATNIKTTTNWTLVALGVGGADKAELDAIASPPTSLNSALIAFTDLDDLAHTLATKCDNCVVNPDKCIPVADCVVGAFADWTPCSALCGGGQQTRKRDVVIWPGPGGKACPALEETRTCNTQACSVDCQVSDWGAWGACSVTCGGGTRKRSRTILVPAAAGGAACPALEESGPCGTDPCPVNCVVSDWSVWGACSAKCGGGQQSRTKTVLVAPLHGGTPCPPTTEQQPCNTAACPPICEFTPWSAWTPCNAPCGGGMQNRTRDPIPMDPKHCHCDIMLVMDRSGSVSTNWPKMVAFAQSLVDGFTYTDQYGMRLGITIFSDTSSLICPITHDKAALTACMAKMPADARGNTMTSAGIETGFAEMQAKMQPGKCRAMKVITDGASTKPTKPTNLLDLAVAKVKTAGIDIYALGVDGSGGVDPVGKAKNAAELQAMASDPKAEHFEMLDTFDGLASVAKKITDKCDQNSGPNAGNNVCPQNTVESQACNLQPCAVDCQVSAWSQFSTCTKDCGGGMQTRTRIIEIPAQNGGKACPPDLTESQPCNTDPCAVGCVVGNWGPWQPCTAPCGGGKQRRERPILQDAANGGAPCPPLVDQQDCNTQPCPVDCVVTDWDPWTACDKPCGTGNRHRERMILVQDANGGVPCPVLKMSESCNTQSCPIDCVPGPWTDWGRCSKDCGLGTQTRTRTVAQPAQFGGIDCTPADLTQSQDCNAQPCPIDCVVAPYGDWGNCSVPCGGGRQTRERQVITIPNFGGAACPDLQESRPCNLQDCVTDCVVSAWSQWSPCSKDCGSGTWTRTRTQLVAPTGGAVCPPLDETQACNEQPCPVDCVVTAWGPWGACSKSCGGGIQTQTRQISTQPQFGGKACPQDLQQTQPCNADACPVNCEVTDWGVWGPCSKPCGSGQQTRTRTVTTPSSAGGNPCPPDLTENRVCNDAPCSIDCVVSDWSDWGDCSVPCGTGQRKRTRTITVTPNFGGQACPPLLEVEACNTQACSVDCVVSTWGPWSPCSQACGKGYSRRVRTIVTAAAFGGQACPPLEENTDCNDFPCAVDCVVSNWGPWGTCSAPCGGGEQARTRSITTQPAFGGSACPKLIDHQVCNDQACPDVECVVSDWGMWSACQEGKQTRTRQVKLLSAGAVCPATQEERAC